MSEERIQELKRKLNDPSDLLHDIGQIMVDASRNAFAEQKLGDVVWPERYGGVFDPFINKAGAVSDFQRGLSQPQESRFQKRPALLSSGNLRDSVYYTVAGKMITVRSDKEYAAAQHYGLSSTEILNEGAVRAMNEWLKSPSGKEYRKIMGGIGKRGFLTTNTIARPFIGMTERARNAIAKRVREFFRV
jgi:phage gpG-like protein